MSTSKDMLAKYLAAEAAILDGKTVTFAGRTVGMEDLSEIRKGRKEWERRVDREAGGASGVPTIGGARYSVAAFDR